MAIISGTVIQNGTNSDDILIGNPAGGANNTINGNGDTDLIYGDSDHVLFVASMGSNPFNAYDFTGDTSLWSTADNPDIADSTTIPHATAVIEGNGAEHWLAITVGAGATITADVDYGTHLIGFDTNAELWIYGTDGTTILASDDNTAFTQGGGGSTSENDPFLNFTFAAAGTYYLRIVQSGGQAIAVGTTYVLNVSLTGQAVTNATPLSGNDTLSGGDANDIIFGGGAHDVIDGDEGVDTLYGGADNDTLDGGTSKDEAFGGAGNDTFVFDDLDLGDNIYGGDGTDTLDVTALDAGFSIVVDLAAETAQLIPNSGSDWEYVAVSIENVLGSSGNDAITGSDQANRLDGDLGNDSLYGGNGSDTLNGGTGDDFIFGGTSTADLRDLVFGGDGNDSIDGGAGNDELNGGNGNDTVLGGAGADTLVGNADNDLIAGGAGGDLMSGNAGADTLNGGFGFDRINGGTGADQFFHQGVRDHGSDWIQDYNAAEGDVLTCGIAGATAGQFQVNFATTVGAGSASVQEAFVIYRPTGQILWVLIDGADDTVINLSIGGQVFDLLA